MPKRINIRANNLAMDFEEIRALPLSVKYQTDNYYSVVGREGIKVDNIAKRIMFPGSKKNRLALGNLHDPTSRSDEYLSALPMIIDVNGDVVFNGKYFVRTVQIKRNVVQAFGTELIGNALDLFGEIGSTSLRSLNIGEVQFTSASIQDSWVGSYDAGDKVIFAPAVYQQLSASNSFDWSHFRPHVYYPAIFDAIAEKFNITFESNLMTTDFFKRHVYCFGVGSAWTVGGVNDGFFRASTQIREDAPVSEAELSMNDFTPPNEDPSNVWNGFRFTSPADNVYNFSGEVPFAVDVEIRFETSTGMSVLIFANQTFNIDGVTLLAGEQAWISYKRSHLSVPPDPSYIEPGLVLTGQGTSLPAFGGTIDISSCLHANDIVAYLDGVSHQFNLAWAFDPATRVVYVDPRHDFTIGSTSYRGFYHNATSPSADQPDDWSAIIDQEKLTMKYVDPFGKHLTLQNIKEDSEIQKVVDAAGSSSTPFGSARLLLPDRGKPGKTSENPYFENLLTLGGIYATNLQGMPVIVPDFTPGDGLPLAADATFESEPKYAYYQGYVDYQIWLREGGSTTATRPAMFQRPSIISSSLSTLEAVASYADFNAAGYSIPGYASIFYPDYHETIFQGIEVAGLAAIKNGDVSILPRDFRRMRKFKVLGQWITCILLEISKFEPMKENILTPVKLLKFAPATEQTLARMIHNQQEFDAQIDITNPV